MRDILIVLGMCVAAIVVGVLFYIYGPAEMREVPSETPSDLQEQASASANGTAAAAEDVSVTVLDAGMNAAAAPERKNIAAYDEEGFARLWAMAHIEGSTPMPDIDFSKQYVIGVFAGTKSSGGHSIAVSRVSDSGDTRTVAITLTKPGPGCITSQAITSPYQIVSVPLSSASLSRTENTVETSCQ